MKKLIILALVPLVFLTGCDEEYKAEWKQKCTDSGGQVVELGSSDEDLYCLYDNGHTKIAYSS